MIKLDKTIQEADRIIAHLEIDRFELLGQWPELLDGIIHLAIAEINAAEWAEACNQLNMAGKAIKEHAPALDTWRAEWHAIWAYYHAQRCDGGEMNKAMQSARQIEPDNANLQGLLQRIQEIYARNCAGRG